MSLYIPETLAKDLENNETKARWIERLPEIVDGCLQRWDLQLDAPLTEGHAEMSYSYLAPASRSDGTEVILKIGGHDLVGTISTISNQERGVLELCEGKGTIRLLDLDENLGALMLERARPGLPLGLSPDDDENTRIASRLMTAFRRPLPDKHDFVPTQYEMDGFDRLRKQFDGTTGPFPEKWVLRAEELYDELMATSAETVVLHADLHHWNILSSEREPWLIIDPKGYYGDPGYDVGAYLANYPDASCEGRDKSKLDVRRIEIMNDELDIPRERVIKWGIVLAVIWARWSVDQPEEVWGESIRRAEVLDGML